MPAKKIEVQEVLLPYIKKYIKVPNMTLAKLVLKENPDVFSKNELEKIRSNIRYYRGKAGEGNKPLVTCEYEPVHIADYLPEIEDENYEPVQIPIGQSRMGVMADFHNPYTERTALETSVKALQKYEINALTLLGDIFDFYPISRFVKDPRKRSIKHEIETGKKLLEYLRASFPKAKIYFKEGNHEMRLPIFLCNKVPELVELELFNLYDIMGMAKLGIEFVPYNKIIKYGNLNMIHGHEMRLNPTALTPPAHTVLQKAKENTLAAHVHRTSSTTNKTIGDETIAAWTVGCMCHTHVDFAIINQWNHGFAFIEMSKDGDFSITNKMVNGSKIY